MANRDSTADKAGCSAKRTKTTEHILQRCPNHDSQPEEDHLANGDSAADTKLYGRREELEKTAPFA